MTTFFDNETDDLTKEIYLNPYPTLNGIVAYRELPPFVEWKYAHLKCTEPRFQEGLLFDPCLRVVFTLQGKSHIQYGNQEVELNAGQGAILPDLGDFREGNKLFYQGTMQKEIVLFFTEEWFNTSGLKSEIFYKLTKNPKAALFLITPTLRLLLTQLLHSEQNPTVYRHAIQANLCTSLLLEVVQMLFPAKSVTETAHFSRTEKLFELLNSGEADNWSIEQIAKACCSNPTTLQREFQKQYGLTIAAYLRDLKMQRAKQALLTGASLTQAAQLAGYKQVEYFSKQFTKAFGSYPSQFCK